MRFEFRHTSQAQLERAGLETVACRSELCSVSARESRSRDTTSRSYRPFVTSPVPRAQLERVRSEFRRPHVASSARESESRDVCSYRRVAAVSIEVTSSARLQAQLERAGLETNTYESSLEAPRAPALPESLHGPGKRGVHLAQLERVRLETRGENRSYSSRRMLQAHLERAGLEIALPA
jgi:hypothetical protein